MGLRSTGLLYPGRDWFLGFGFFSTPLWLVFFLKRLFEGASLTIHHNKNGGWSAATKEKFEICSFFLSFFSGSCFVSRVFFSRFFFFFLRFHLSSFWCPLWLGRFMVGNGSPGSKS